MSGAPDAAKGASCCDVLMGKRLRNHIYLACQLCCAVAVEIEDLGPSSLVPRSPQIHFRG